MSYCKSCGGPVKDEDRFCPRCGTPNPDFIGNVKPQKSKTGLWIGLACLGGVLIGIVTFLIVNSLNNKASSETAGNDANNVVAASDVAVADSVSAPVVEEAAPPAPVKKERTFENGLYGEKVTMKGKIDGYPVTFEFKISNNGDVSGRYSYDSTIRKYGKKAANYFTISGTLYDGGTRMDLIDYLPKDDYPHDNLELWVTQNGSHFNISGNIYNNTNGETYDIYLKY